jgi:Family of unknown function (DUF5856)
MFTRSKSRGDRKSTSSMSMSTSTSTSASKTRKSARKSGSLLHKKDIVLKFMEMLTTVKIHHWKTRSYATHKATDELYEDLNKYIDEFVEVMLGKDHSSETNRRISMICGGGGASGGRGGDSCVVRVFDCSDQDSFVKKIEEYKSFLIGLNKKIDGERSSDLLNIRDEILATLNKTTYLLTFA